jgi:ABC transport system ATP-binding/permease protein
MKTCPSCATANADADVLCQHCGQRLDNPAGVLSLGGGADRGLPTTRWAGLPSTGRTFLRGIISLDALFSASSRLVIGRAPDCDVCLQHPSVSRYHALLERLPDGLRLSDLRSVNGIFIDGRRLSSPSLVHEHQRVGIGPFLFTLIDDIVHALDSSRSLRLEAVGLGKVVRLVGGQNRTLLDDITLAVEPGEFVSLLGPSGSGKSTLMDCLNGRRRATAGRVLANGEDFYRLFDSFRQSLGYVPQKDIVHTHLTVHRALYYTARLRLPADTDRTELAARVEEVLDEMELAPHRDTLIANLSGGQARRVSLGAELLARPCLLYIDEATSGLDAGVEARLMRLFRRLADEGRSIVCITHNVDHVDQCHLVLVLASGRLVYYGPPAEAPPYFGVGRISEIYDRLQEKDPDAWRREFTASSLHREFVEKRRSQAGDAPLASASLAPATATGDGTPSLRLGGLPPDAVPPSGKPLLAQRLHDSATGPRKALALLKPVSELWLQFRVLTCRYAELVWGDARSVFLLFCQAPIVAAFILLGFAGRPFAEQIPATRRLTPDERQALRDASDALAGLDQLPWGQRKVLEAMEVPRPDGRGRVKVLSVLKTFQGADRARVLEQLLATDEPVVPYDTITNPAYTYMLLNIVVIAVLWFGCNNAAKEIVKEEAIYGRERAVNLSILPYLGSKFVVLSVISAVQTFLFMLVIYGVLAGLHALLGSDMPPAVYRLDYLPQYGVLLLLAMTGVALGLLLSACVATPDRANALLPYVVIPQIILGGGIIAVRGGLLFATAALLSPAYWAYRAVRRGACDLPADFYYRMDYNDGVWLACAALAVQMVALLLATAWFLRRKDLERG